MDASDYESIRSALDAGFDAGRSEAGDFVPFGYGQDGSVWRRIYQDNGWVCVQHFYDDGTVVETYER